jgi:hypothetical protein
MPGDAQPLLDAVRTEAVHAARHQPAALDHACARGSVAAHAMVNAGKAEQEALMAGALLTAHREAGRLTQAHRAARLGLKRGEVDVDHPA